MSAGTDVLDQSWGPFEEDTLAAVGEGVWFVWRSVKIAAGLDIRNGMWFTDDGAKVVSLAMGAGLHYHGGIDWETYVFRPGGVDIDVCCHDTEDEARRCALTFMASGHWCQDDEDEQ